VKKSVKIVFAIILAFAPLLFNPPAAHARETLYPPMDNGELDRPDLPFDYFSKPTTVLGTRLGGYGTEVTPEGFLFTGYAEMGFFAGPGLDPVNQRVKILEAGYLPIVNMRFSIAGANYDIQYFADTLDGKFDGPVVNLIRVTISNPGTAKTEARFGAGMRYGYGLPNRSMVHMGDNVEGVLGSFNPNWAYAFRPDAALRGGKVIYTFDTKIDEAFIKQGAPYNFDEKNMKVQHGQADWVGIAAWKRTLKPGQSFTLNFTMPYEPAEPKAMPSLRKLDYDALLKKTIDGWNSWLAAGTTIDVPETKVNDTYKASLIYLAIAIDKTGDDYIQKVNEFQYDHFWIRDAAFILTAFGETGHTFESEMGSLYFLKWQTPEGNFASQRGQLDGFGQALWTFGRHYQLTRDREYLEKIWPQAMKAFDWLRKARAAEKARLPEGSPGYGLMPISNPGDNELVEGHVIGHDLWALHGLTTIRSVAPDAATPEEINALDAEIADYRLWLDYNLNEIAKRTGGFITPAVEPGGNDWGNLKMIWPTHILDPMDRRETETIRMARYKYQEGIMSYDYGKALHHYIGLDIPLSLLERGEQSTALLDFYSELAHTSSTHGGFEWSIKPWGDRNYGGNIAPHGCFAGKYLLLYRNMFVREDGNELDLGSALSPFWLRPGKTVSVENAPTSFGAVSFKLEVRDSGATLTLSPPTRAKPDKIVLHLPQGFDVTGVDAPGVVLESLKYPRIILPPDTTRVEIKWTVHDPVLYNFRNAVENYLHVYWSLHTHDSPKDALFDQD
jgi:hypothetical protein